MSLWWIHWYYFASWQHYTWIPCKTSPHLWFSVHLIATTDADSPHRRCGNVTNSLKESSCSSKCTTFKDFRSIYISGAFLSNCTPESHPGDTWRNNNVIITSKRRFDVMMTLLQSSRMDFTLRLPISRHKHQMIIILTNPTSDIWILRLTWQTCWRDFVKTVIMASCFRQDFDWPNLSTYIWVTLTQVTACWQPITWTNAYLSSSRFGFTWGFHWKFSKHSMKCVWKLHIWDCVVIYLTVVS